MKTAHSVRIVVFIIATACAITTGWSQVDPAWLRAWNESQQRRPATISPIGTIATQSEDGPRLIIRGRVLTPDGRPAGNVLVHSYHRDQDGFDFGPNDSALTTWRLQGWARTDRNGNFEFRTIRPAPDHLGREAAHIHFTLVSEEFGRQWAPKVFFSDDPLVSADQHRRSQQAGKFGVVRELGVDNGVEQIDVNFRLKENADF